MPASHTSALVAATPFKLVQAGTLFSGEKQAAQPAILRDLYFGGFGRITGTVAEKSTPANTPLRRRVVLTDDRSRMAIRETWSDATTGEYTFNGIRPDCRYTVTSFDHSGQYRAVIADNLLPDAI